MSYNTNYLTTQDAPGSTGNARALKFCPGTVRWVNSGGGGSTTSGGLTPAAAYTTLASAISASSAGDTIYLMEGHNENIGNEQINVSVAGLKIIGLGYGTRRPRFDFDHANASINIAASNVYMSNIRLLPSVTAVLIGIDIETLNTDTTLEDIEVLPGEDGAGVDEFVLGIDLKVGVDRTVIRRFKYRQHASAANTNAGISLSGASDDIFIDDCDIKLLGTDAVAPIKGITTLSTNVRIRNCVLTSDAEPGIELLTGTTGTIENCYIFSDLATIAAAIVADGCACFENYYVEVGNESGALIKTASADD